MMPRIRIAPSVLAADFSYLRGEVARVEQGGADLLHLDIMDGHFVPNISFGPGVVAKVHSVTKLPLDVHLMVTNPRQFVTSFVEAGASNITIHVECADTIYTAISEIKVFDCTAGLALRPKTPLSAAKEHLAYIDRLLIMTVEPGFGGQKFMEPMLEKVKEAVEIRRSGNYKFDIEVDGGLDKYTIWPAVRAGAEVIVAGTSVFGQPDAELAIRELREGARAALAHLYPEEPAGQA
jgi:ribulose-phosphate 3-epimerase